MGLFNLFRFKEDRRARLSPSGHVLDIQAGDNLLNAALKAGLHWKHDCRVGCCGTCVCRLKKGRIKALSDFSFVLTPEQIKQGMILACQSALRSDIEVEVDFESKAKDQQAITFQGQIASVKHLTHDILEVVVKLDKGLPATTKAGQFMLVSTPEVTGPRSYSLAKAPENETERQCTFFIRKIPGGEFSEWLFEKNRVGRPLMVSGPHGTFWLRPKEGPIVCIAGGSGLAPIKAMLENAANVGIRRDVLLLFGARTQRDLYCVDGMISIRKKWAKPTNFTFIPVLSAEPQDSNWGGARGNVTDYLKKRFLDKGLSLQGCQGYLCGPPVMIDEGIEMMIRASIHAKDIFYDKFYDARNLPRGKGSEILQSERQDQLQGAEGLTTRSSTWGNRVSRR